MERQRPVVRWRERLVLGQLGDLLDAGEEVMAWAHVKAHEDGRSGVVLVTKGRCIVHWADRNRPDVTVAWEDLRAWELEHAGRGHPLVTFYGASTTTTVRLPASSRTRVDRTAALLRTLDELAPAGHPDLDVRMEPRGILGHIRRGVVTVLGSVVILVGVIFASPVVPGPGILTILAGLAILATEYEWASDLHHWLRRSAERLWQRLRARRQRRRIRKGS